MSLTIQLANDSFGVIRSDNNDPAGLLNFERELKRSRDNDGVVFNFSLSLNFNKALKNYIQNVFEALGPDGIITATLFRYDPNNYVENSIYTGEIKLDNYDLGEVDVITNIEQVSFERKFLNLSERDVQAETLLSESGVTLPSTPTIDLEYHAKTIVKKYESSTTDEQTFSQPGAMTFQFGPVEVGPAFRYRDEIVFGQIDNGDKPRDEIRRSFIVPYGFSSLSPAEYLLMEEAGDTEVEVSVELQHGVTVTQTGGSADIDAADGNAGLLGNTEVKVFFRHEDQIGNIKQEVEFGQWVSNTGLNGLDSEVGNYETFSYSTSIVAEVNDRIYVYYTWRVFSNYKLAGQGPTGQDRFLNHEFSVASKKENTFVRVTTNTIFPATRSKSILIYELLDKVCQAITDQPDAFRSDFFGRTDSIIPYPNDGPGSLLALTNGRNLRDLDNKEIFVNWQDLFQSLTSIFCLSWGFETLPDGKKIIRCEPKPTFFDKNITVLKLGKVAKLRKRNFRELYFGQAEVGYPKIEDIGQTNGIDEFNTIRRFKSPLFTSKGKLDLRSVYRMSGFEIESQRRLRFSSEESRLDDENFLVAVVRDATDPSGYKTEKNQNFTAINGLFDSENVYNLRYSPARNIKNWKKILATNVVRGNNTTFRFGYGEINYTMSSQLNTEGALVGENESLVLDKDDALYYPELYSFESELTNDEWTLIEQNPFGVIQFIDWNSNICEGFLFNVKQIVEGNKGTFELIRVYRSQT